jgi:adenosylhomocysteine nucleosidase
MRTLVITPMRAEQSLFLRHAADRGFIATAATAGRLPIQNLPKLDLTLAVGGTGKVQFAVQTQHLLDSEIAPELVICLGAAGSLADYLEVGDIVVATETVEHDVRKRFVAQPLPRFAADRAIIDSLAQVPRVSLSFPIHFGIVASGDEDVVDFERKRSLRRETDGIAVAWEGAGGAKACRFSGVSFIEVRGITDAADEGAPSDFEQNLNLAMENLVSFIITWLTQEL